VSLNSSISRASISLLIAVLSTTTTEATQQEVSSNGQTELHAESQNQMTGNEAVYAEIQRYENTLVLSVL
jgi:hypothetical protein